MTQRLLSKVLKAVYSGAIAFLGSLATALNGDATFTSLADGQWIWIGLTTLLAAGGTFGLASWSGPTVAPTPPPSGEGK